MLLQTADVSVLPFQAHVDAGKRIIVLLTYDARWSSALNEQTKQDSVEVRLISGDSVISCTRGALCGWKAAFVISPAECPAEGLEIRHLVKPGTAVPLNSIVVLAVDPEATSHELQRAQWLCGWAARDHALHSEKALESTKFPAKLDLWSRDAVVLTDGDSLVFDIPADYQYDRLHFAVGGMRIVDPVDAMITLEADMGNGWQSVAVLNTKEAIVPFEWQPITIPFPKSPSRVRFSFCGEEHVVAVAEPVLIPPTIPTTARRNLLIIDLDTMRADRLGCYGYTTRPTSARLDSFVDANGFRIFRRAYSSAPWTLPATAKFLTSRFVNIEQARVIPREYTTLAEILRASGYFCIAFTGGAVMRFQGFEQGFHEYYATDRIGKIEDTFPDAIRWVEEQHIQPFFVFLHTYETHTPYTRETFSSGLPRGRLGDLSVGERYFPSEWTRTQRVTRAESLHIEATYDSSVRKACDATVDLLVRLERLGLLEHTVVIILSDHGEEFWDHSAVFSDHPHGSVYNELLHVPFMAYVPDFRQSQSVSIEDEVSTVDLVPTVADLLDIRVPVDVDGVSLRPLMEGKNISRIIPIIGMTWPEHRGDIHISPDDCRVCVVSDGTKYIEQLDVRADVLEAGEPLPSFRVNEEMYDLTDDPNETDDRSDDLLEESAEMRGLLRNALHQAGRRIPEVHGDTLSVPMPADLVRQLTALGYINGE